MKHYQKLQINVCDLEEQDVLTSSIGMSAADDQGEWKNGWSTLTGGKLS